VFYSASAFASPIRFMGKTMNGRALFTEQGSAPQKSN
jgi:hypothetical protein